MPKLIVQLGGQEWAVDLKPGSNVVGRQSTCTVPLKDPSLSRQHCEFVVEGSRVTMVDKGSMNGTLVNGKKVPQQVLNPGDKVTLGQATLWYERKNVAAESRTPPARPPAPPDPQVHSQVATRRSMAAVSAPATASVAVAPPGASPVPDYAVRVRSGGGWVKIVALVAVLAALGVGGFMARDFFKSDASVGQADDPDNRLGKTAGFDRSAGGKPEGWTLREKGASALSVDPSQGRRGPCMVIEKASSELVVEAVYGEDLALGNTSTVEAEVYSRFENFLGWAALKIDWLREPRGPVVGEEFSDLAKCPQWTSIKTSFTPPAGARAFRVSLAAIGRAGRVFFDDVSVKARTGPGAGPEHRIGGHVVRPTRQGVLQIAFRGRQALLNVGVRLESEREGAMPQSSALQVSLTPQQDVLVFLGKLLNPLDFREIEFEEQVGVNEGGTGVSWRFKGVDLRQVDRVTAQLGLPQVDSIQGLPESPDQPVLNLACSASDGDFVIELNEPARVRELQVQGRRRLFLSWTVNSQQEELVFGFTVKALSGDGPRDPEKAAEEAEKARQYGKAWALLTGFLPKIKDAAQKERVEAKVKRLEESEKREWDEVLAQAFQADFSGRPDLLKRAQESLDLHLAQWRGANVEGKAQKVREDLRRQGDLSSANEVDRPKKILAQAKKLAESGKRSVAEAVLRALLAKYPASDVADEAKQLLGTLGQ